PGNQLGVLEVDHPAFAHHAVGTPPRRSARWPGRMNTPIGLLGSGCAWRSSARH
ncbi:hypothetical protein G9O61_00g022740, partial [Vairimorpha ceranae]